MYGAALFRLRKEDFGELKHHDGISPAWPISYDELEPYYTEAEYLYHVHGLRGEDPTEPAASKPYRFAPVAHELRIQKRADGSLEHPPVPALWQDKAAPIDYVVASGRGTVFSFVVHHAPKVPGRTLPFVIALVDLEEGVRMLGELRNVDPATVAVGMPVSAIYLDFPANDVGPAWTLYAWEPDA